jgi:hypothetical protein
MTDEEVSDDVSEVEDAIVDDGVKGVKEDSVELSLDDAGIREITLEDELMELVGITLSEVVSPADLVESEVWV